MTELLAALTCLWLLALSGWSAHEWGKKAAGSAALFLALVGFTATAIYERPAAVKEIPTESDALMVKHVAASLPASSVEHPATPLEPLGSSLDHATAKYLKDLLKKE